MQNDTQLNTLIDSIQPKDAMLTEYKQMVDEVASYLKENSPFKVAEVWKVSTKPKYMDFYLTFCFSLVWLAR